MSSQSDLQTMKGVADLLDANRAARFGYTEAAFNDETGTGIGGVADFDQARPQNIPDAEHTDYPSQLLDWGAQSSAASIPRRAWNHFIGRFSFNLGKLVQKFAVLLTVVMAHFAHNWAEYDASANYQAGDVCYLVTSNQFVVYRCKANNTKGRDPTQAAYWDLVTLDTANITSGRLPLDRLPTGAADRLLMSRTAGESPLYDILKASDVPVLSATKITSDRLSQDRMPTSATAARFLKVLTAGQSPAYSAILASDVPNIPATKITSERLTLDRLPTSATANRFVVVRTANGSPIFDILKATDIPALDASKVTTGRFTLARLPTNATADRIIVVRTANGSPVWGVLTADDVPALDAAKVTTGRFPLARLPTSETANRFCKVGAANSDPAWSPIAYSDISDLLYDTLNLTVDTEAVSATIPKYSGTVNVHGELVTLDEARFTALTTAGTYAVLVRPDGSLYAIEPQYVHVWLGPPYYGWYRAEAAMNGTTYHRAIAVVTFDAASNKYQHLNFINRSESVLEV